MNPIDTNNIHKINKRTFNIICYAAIMLFAVLFLYIGNRIAVGDFVIFNAEDGMPTVEAKVTKIVDVSEEAEDFWDNKVIIFEASVTSGLPGAIPKGGIVKAAQNISSFDYQADKEVEPGDRVMLSSSAENEWYFFEYARINQIVILGIVFVVLLFIFGRIKGLNAILALGLTCVAIFAVFIPSILSDKNIYVSAVIVCVYSVVVTLFMVNGVNKKALAAVAGCFGGIVAIAVLTLLMERTLGLTGIVSDESVHLIYMERENPINLKAIIFAGIMIGAVGAVMDVAMSIATALWELRRRAPHLDFAKFFKSGINMGQDIMGTMANTLVLAYTGGSLTIILLLVVYSNSFMELMNREMVIVELLQAIAGSFGILLTIPLTSLICAVLYPRKTKKAGPGTKRTKREAEPIEPLF
jgi:uncharacterized membrane protein